MSDYSKLKTLAQAATPGWWEHRFVDGDGTSGAICHEHGWVADDFTEQSFKDTAYMAAANPAAVLELIEENEAMLKFMADISQSSGDNWAVMVARQFLKVPAK